MSTISGMQGMSNILGRAEQEIYSDEQKQTGSASSMGKEEFLTLLITQLENQDPTEPMKDEDFVAQLAQFNSLEQLINISDQIGSLVNESNQSQMVQAVEFLGKEVSASGSSIYKQGEDVSRVEYTLNSDASSVYINIYDSESNIIRTVQPGAKESGTYEFSWDGLDYAGREVEDGQYSIDVLAENANGEQVSTSTDISGIVSGVEMQNNEAVLTMQDGRIVNLTDIKEVIDK